MLQLTHVMRVVLPRLPIAVIKMMYTHNEIQRMRQSRSPKFTAIYSRKWQIIGILWQALVNIHTGRSRQSRSSPSHTENNSKAIENAQHQAMPRQNQDVVTLTRRYDVILFFLRLWTRAGYAWLSDNKKKFFYCFLYAVLECFVII